MVGEVVPREDTHPGPDILPKMGCWQQKGSTRMETCPIPFHQNRVSSHSPGSVTGLHFQGTSEATPPHRTVRNLELRLHRMAIGTPAQSMKSLQVKRS